MENVKDFNASTGIKDQFTENVRGSIFKNRIYRMGLLFVVLASALYCAVFLNKPNDSFPIFIITYSASLVLIFFTIRVWKKMVGNIKLKKALVYLNFALWFISCFALNLNMRLFPESTLWLQVIIVGFVMLCVIQPFVSTLSGAVKSSYYFLYGFCFMVQVYFTIMLIPTMFVGAVAILLLGIGIHSFVPLLIIIFGFIMLKYEDMKSRILFFSGICLSVIVVIVSCLVVYFRIARINHFSKIESMDGNGQLPMWINVAQKLDDDYLNFHVLRTNYGNGNFNDLFGVLKINTRDDKNEHDPLVVLTGLIAPQLNLDRHEKLQVLEALSLNSNLSESRLWSGHDLVTQFVGTNIVIDPEERTSYTEKLFTIHNNSPWGDQEAIYTLQLPEGSVVTSLSLWINGKEERAVLTSKGKANKAYNTVVGIERRDPSLVEWREGNCVSLRVFPVNSGGDRRVKIGVVSPLQIHGESLAYEGIKVVGTNLNNAEERIQVKVLGGLAPSLPFGFDKSGQAYSREQKLDQSFGFNVKLIPATTKDFFFNGENYIMDAYQKEYQFKKYERIYLDLNDAWTLEEIERVCALSRGMKIYYNDSSNELVKLSDEEPSDLAAIAQQLHFSLFPYFKVKSPESAVIVTHVRKHSPSLTNVLGSNFGDLLKENLGTSCYDVFNIGLYNNLYNGSLSQFNAINVDFGTLEDLAASINKQRFVKNPNLDENVVVFAQSGLKITKGATTSTTLKSSGTENIVRLYESRKISQAYGPIFLGLSQDSTLITRLVQSGQEANVVTPTTSLIVLESQGDYERLGVKNDTKTLGNSTIFNQGNAGAAPEPHEWAIIFLCGIFLAYVYRIQLLTKLSGIKKQ